MSNVDVVQARVEEFHPEKRYDGALARAFAPPDRLLQSTAHLLVPGGRLLAMLGRTEPPPQADDWKWCETQALDVPGESGQRHVMIFEHL